MGGDDVSATFNVLQAADLVDFQFYLGQTVLSKWFSSIAILYLAHEDISPLARHRRLKEVLLRHADEMRQARQEARALYSAIHLNRLFQAAIGHLARTIDVAFDFVHAARTNNLVYDDLQQHVRQFGEIATGAGIDDEAMDCYIASCLLMDAYPPGMHREQ